MECSEEEEIARKEDEHVNKADQMPKEDKVQIDQKQNENEVVDENQSYQTNLKEAAEVGSSKGLR